VILSNGRIEKGSSRARDSSSIPKKKKHEMTAAAGMIPM
jgi:hypothetical protein